MTKISQFELQASIIEMIKKRDEHEKQKLCYEQFLLKYFNRKKKRWGMLGSIIYSEKRFKKLLNKFDENL